MRLSFRYEPADLVEMTHVARKRLPFPLAYARHAMVAVVVIILTMVIWTEVAAYRSRTLRWAEGAEPLKGRFIPWLVMVGCIVAILSIVKASTPFAQAKRSLATQKTLRGEKLFEATLDGVTMTSADTVTRWQWSAFSRMTECERTFLLETDQNHFVIVPKRAFSDAAQMNEFREFARALQTAPR